jgi:KaiC/GvpD/RAD55 family RecA-like ATPase
LNNVEIYGDLIRNFIGKMTSPSIGQFRLETSTFRIILERARTQKPTLIKFTITENGRVINDLDESEESLVALQTYMKRSVDFISSLIGEELAKDVIGSSLKESMESVSDSLRGDTTLIHYIPIPFNEILKEIIKDPGVTNDHEAILGLFEDVFHAYLKDLSEHTDLSAFKLKLSILREEHELLKYLSLNKDNMIDMDRDKWATASDEEVKEALVATFNSMVGLSTFLLGREEAVKRASRIFNYYFEGKNGLLKRYGMEEEVLDGAFNQRISTGIKILDDRLDGGIPKGSSLLFVSPSGIERDTFISRIVTEGLKEESSILMVLSKEPPRSIRMLLKSQGMDPEQFEEEGSLRIVDWFSWRGERIIGVEKEGYALKSSKILSNLGIAINKGLRELKYATNKIALVHIIGPATNIFEFTQVYNFIQRLRAKFKEEEMASIFILESETLTGDRKNRIMEIFDGIIELSKTMEGGRLRRELSIINTSWVDFEASPIPFMIRESRIIPMEEVEKEEREKLDKVLSPGTKEDKEPEEIEEASEEDVELLEEAIRKGTYVVDQKMSQSRKSGTAAKKKVARRTLLKNGRSKPKPHPAVVKDTKKKPEKKGDTGTVKRKRIRKVLPKHQKEGNDFEALEEGEGSTEDILLEAIQTIDDLLEGSKKNLTSSSDYHKRPTRKKE